MRVAMVPGPGGRCWTAELASDGAALGQAVTHDSVPAAVAALERAASGQPDGVRWVWPTTASVYPALLRAGVEVARCYDVALLEALLLGREGRMKEPASLAGAWARLHGLAAPASRPGQQAAQQQAVLFEPADPVFPTPEAALAAVIEVHADQQRRITADEHPDRFTLLAAADSAGSLAAAEMSHHGLPWRADVHTDLLTALLGIRPAPGMRPPRLASLAAAISEAFGGRPVNPDSPAQVSRALAADGVRVPSTRSAVLRECGHPAAPLLLEYKELARLHTANGWTWLEEWVSDGRFRPEYVVAGVVSGRWASRGGGALQIPRVLRRAVVADPGWVLVVADAAQLEPRVLAALSGDSALAVAAGTGDLYEALAGMFGGDRAKVKIALLSAMYGGAAGEARQLLAVLQSRFPDAARYVEEAARAGEEGRVVRSRLGRTCPPPSQAWRGLTAVADDPATGDRRAGLSLRARGRFTRNFVVQASAADWAAVLLALLRTRLATLEVPDTGDVPNNPDRAHLVFFQHDEVVVHCPSSQAEAAVAAVQEAADEAGRLVFGHTPVRFPVTTAVVPTYADAK
ncbi:MAG TPA: bifunctional 3'-5' exonuclease/DNA polymerase [Streptosporangiaceae bacterium]|nr:bifunctional 3'-5' exonuclease/DNA polymerase [Streptosporangiaceae bacterium]